MDLGPEKAAKSAKKESSVAFEGEIQKEAEVSTKPFCIWTIPGLWFSRAGRTGLQTPECAVFFFPCGVFILHSVFSLGRMLPVTWLIISCMKCAECFEFKHDTLRSPWQALSLTLGPTGAVFGFLLEKGPVSRICCWRHQEVYKSPWEFILKVVALPPLLGAPLGPVWNMHL